MGARAKANWLHQQLKCISSSAFKRNYCVDKIQIVHLFSSCSLNLHAVWKGVACNLFALAEVFWHKFPWNSSIGLFFHISFLLYKCMHTSQPARQFIYMKCIWCRHVSCVHSAAVQLYKLDWMRKKPNRTVNKYYVVYKLFEMRKWYFHWRWILQKMKWNAKHNMAFVQIQVFISFMWRDCQLMQMQTSIILTRNMFLPYFLLVDLSSLLRVCFFVIELQWMEVTFIHWV